MEQLITLVKDKTGINPDQARGAVDTVLNFLKERLPAPLAEQINKVVSGGGGEGGANLGDVGKNIGGMFGS